MGRIGTLALFGWLLVGLVLGCGPARTSTPGEEPANQKSDKPTTPPTSGQEKPLPEEEKKQSAEQKLVGSWVITAVKGTNDPAQRAMKGWIFTFYADGRGRLTLVTSAGKTPMGTTWKLSSGKLTIKQNLAGDEYDFKIKSLTADKMVLVDPEGKTTESLELDRVKEARPAANSKDEEKKLEGTWYSHATEANGKQTSGENKEYLLIIAGNKCTTKVKGKVVGEDTFTLFERKPYWVIDFEQTAPENRKGKHWHAIYRIDGDTLQWIGENSDARAPAFTEEEYEKLPKAFQTKQGDGQWMRTMKRLKDK
jgi:uncharacterized protein (TIGR03067 family)